MNTALLAAQVVVAVAMAFALYRLLRGPRAQDRVLALGVRQATTLYFEAALVIGMLGFVSTAALAKFLLRGEVIE